MLKSEIPSVKSRVKYVGNYREELKKIMDALEEAIQTDMAGHLEIASVIPGNANLKIRIDDERGARIVNCVFRYYHNDTKFGNIHIDLVTSALAKKPETHVVGKFLVTDHDGIRERVLEELIAVAKIAEY